MSCGHTPPLATRSRALILLPWGLKVAITHWSILHIPISKPHPQIQLEPSSALPSASLVPRRPPYLALTPHSTCFRVCTRWLPVPRPLQRSWPPAWQRSTQRTSTSASPGSHVRPCCPRGGGGCSYLGVPPFPLCSSWWGVGLLCVLCRGCSVQSQC